MDLVLMMLFWGAMALNVITVILYFSSRESAWLFFTPWMGLVLGFSWFALCRSYFAQPEVSLDVPIRVDLVLLPPLMAFALFAGGVRLIRAGQRAVPEGRT